MRCSRVLLLILLFISVVLILTLSRPLSAYSPILQTTETPTPEPEFFRTIEAPVTAIATGKVNIRSEASLNGSIIQQASAGDEFDIRYGIEWVEANGYTWVPIVASGQDAWIVLTYVTVENGEVQVPVSSEEIAQMYEMQLPIGIAGVAVENNQLVGVDETGQIVAVWDWGPVEGQGRWEIIAANVLLEAAYERENDLGGPQTSALVSQIVAEDTNVQRAIRVKLEKETLAEVPRIVLSDGTAIPWTRLAIIEPDGDGRQYGIFPARRLTGFYTSGLRIDVRVEIFQIPAEGGVNTLVFAAPVTPEQPGASHVFITNLPRATLNEWLQSSMDNPIRVVSINDAFSGTVDHVTTQTFAHIDGLGEDMVLIMIPVNIGGQATLNRVAPNLAANMLMGGASIISNDYIIPWPWFVEIEGSSLQ